QLGATRVDPRPYAAGSLQGVFAKYSHLGAVLPAMGYGAEQMRELEATINATPADVVVIGTPIDLGRLLKLNKPAVRVRYELEERGGVTVEPLLERLPPAAKEGRWWGGADAKARLKPRQSRR